MKYNSTSLLTLIDGQLFLVGCGDRQAEPVLTCAQTLKVTSRDGGTVFEAVNGLYIKTDFPVFECASRPYSDNLIDRKYVQSGLEYLHWYNGVLYSPAAKAKAEATGKWLGGAFPPDASIIIVEIQFGHSQVRPDWWYLPALPHTRYPIDLLPNFGREVAVANAEVNPLKNADSIYWRVRGGPLDANQKYSVTQCDIKAAPNDLGRGATSLTDPRWLIQGETKVEENVGNTCRGRVDASNRRPIGARVDVPGSAVKEIDKIYLAVSKYLAELTVD